jgi:redox-sensitive bicupin YhaK (pirin superfamily)
MSAVKQIISLGAGPAPWPTLDPFLFCVHHNDDYPAGTAELSPSEPLTGRSVGSDFSSKDGWSMYHGSVTPGFPQHPHRGFETISYVRQGLIDHSDSMGAAARFGTGDVQWMTAGSGIVHAEMFPLLKSTERNPMELFQVWMNLPARDKMVDPYFTMLWDHQVPKHTEDGVNVTIIAGTLADRQAAAAPPNSWAARAEADVAIWHIVLEAGASWTLPAAGHAEANRVLYVFGGGTAHVDGERVASDHAAVIDAAAEVLLAEPTGQDVVEILLLQGRPIGEPVAQYGPFVMNTEAEIRQAFADYKRTQFGGWPWPSADPNHGPDRGRFARHSDGRVEEFDDAGVVTSRR